MLIVFADQHSFFQATPFGRRRSTEKVAQTVYVHWSLRSEIIRRLRGTFRPHPSVAPNFTARPLKTIGYTLFAMSCASTTKPGFHHGSRRESIPIFPTSLPRRPSFNRTVHCQISVLKQFHGRGAPIQNLDERPKQYLIPDMFRSNATLSTVVLSFRRVATTHYLPHPITPAGKTKRLSEVSEGQIASR